MKYIFQRNRISRTIMSMQHKEENKMDKRITYKRQQSGEYHIFLDGKFYCSSDNWQECKADIEELEEQLAKEEENK